MPDFTVIIFNPSAKGERAVRFIDDIRKLAAEAELLPTASAEDATQFARQAVADGVKTVVAAGGDGTINQVVNGIAGSEARLGLLPVGTMNVFATELGVPTNDVRAAWELIVQGNVRKVDLPLAGNRYFVQMAGIGLDAQVVQETDLDFRKTFGPLSYLMTATHIASRTPPEIRVKSECGRDTKGSFVLVGNGRYYGGPFPLFKKASNVDSLLDVIIFHNLGYLDIVRYLQGVITGSHTKMHDVEYFQTPGIDVTGNDHLPVEVDGELAGNLPIKFRLAKSKLNVICPAE